MPSYTSPLLNELNVNDSVWLRLEAKTRLRIGPGVGPLRIVRVSTDTTTSYCIQIQMPHFDGLESRWIRLDEILCKGVKMSGTLPAIVPATVYTPRTYPPFAPPIPARDIFSKIGYEGSQVP